MRKTRMIILALIILALIIAVPVQIYASTPETLVEQAEKELIETLRILDEAGSTADATSLESITTQLNEALRLIEEAKLYMSQGRITEANNSAEEALSLIEKAKSEAESTLKLSSQRALQIQAFSWTLVPVASLLTPLTLTKGYKWYVKRERRKLLNMTITRKRRKSNDV